MMAKAYRRQEIGQGEMSRYGVGGQHALLLQNWWDNMQFVKVSVQCFASSGWYET
jgi:hypothetical protein